jgi:hypothetical protein
LAVACELVQPERSPLSQNRKLEHCLDDAVSPSHAGFLVKAVSTPWLFQHQGCFNATAVSPSKLFV